MSDLKIKDGSTLPNKYMGLNTRQEGNYITILNGKFCQRVTKETPGAIERVNKKGNTVHEKFYDNFTGKLVGIKTQDGEYGKSWIFSFKDKEDVYHLQLSYSNSFATQFLKILPNVDLAKEMKVSPSVKEVDGKNKSSLFVNQNGVAIKHAYTRETPNGIPDLEQVTVKGQLVWDDTKRIAWLYDMVAKNIIPKLEAANGGEAVAVPESTKASSPLEYPAEEVNPLDIPF